MSDEITISDQITIEILKNKINLDIVCWACDGGRKESTMKNDDGSCETCKGKKFTLTDVGESILDFIKRHSHKEKS